MKLRIKPSIPLCALLLLAACSSGGDAPADGTAPEAPVALELSAQMGGVTVEPQTRAHGDIWDAGDAIGVFTYPKLSATAEATNVQYTTEAGGKTQNATVFIPFAPVGTPIYLSSQEVYVYAYYPYKSDTNANTTPEEYPISTADKSSQQGIDWLVTGRVESTEPLGPTPITKNNPAVKLNFRHALAKVQVNLLHGEGMKASDLTTAPTVSIGAGLKTTAKLNLFYGTLRSLGGESTATITMKHMGTKGIGKFKPGDDPAEETADQSYEAIILPQSYNGGVTVTIAMGDGRYYFQLPAPTSPEANVFTAGYRYIYNVRVKAKDLTVTSTVTPWDTDVTEAAPISTSMAETALTVEWVSGTPTVTFDDSYEYRTNTSGEWSAWATYSAGVPLSAAGHKVQFRGNAYPGDSDEGKAKKIQVEGTGTVKVYGNAMSLKDKTSFASLTSMDGTYNFAYLFKENTSLTDASGLVLPATTMVEYCYQNMFEGCTALTTPPALPATTLAHGCYKQMFKDCSALTAAPALPATTLQEECYFSMFEGCSNASFTTAPDLIAPTLVKDCYGNMFMNCSNLCVVRCYATAKDQEHVSHWLDYVSSTGDFYDYGGAGWTAGSDGIPSDWTIHH